MIFCPWTKVKEKSRRKSRINGQSCEYDIQLQTEGRVLLQVRGCRRDVWSPRSIWIGARRLCLNETQNAWIYFSDWRYVALMPQDRLHKHSRNAAARKETRNERSHFLSYAQTGCHYAQWSQCATSRWGPEWKLRRQRRKLSSERSA